MATSNQREYLDTWADTNSERIISDVERLMGQMRTDSQSQRILEEYSPMYVREKPQNDVSVWIMPSKGGITLRTSNNAQFFFPIEDDAAKDFYRYWFSVLPKNIREDLMVLNDQLLEEGI